MDDKTRNKLQNATQDARRLLANEFAEQLEGTYDILPDGRILPEVGKHLDNRQRLIRRKLVDAVEHLTAGGRKPAEAIADYTREAAFTFLNRFVALKMLEARGLVQQCISKGDQSSGFKEFTGLAPGLVEVLDHGYRPYLECLFDELSVEVKVLFDRCDVASLLWPRRQALTDLLDILNQPDLAGVWDQDETIGWIYQYFNSQEERRQMREESQAPRNSRELAVRNQFFTPRYVVEFLTDNTLGRIWYEMRQGETRLKEQCRYLVRRPNEVFLNPGQSGPPAPSNQVDLSQEELLKQPVHISHRPTKDPRTIRLLDPTCGSMHFGLYAFDLFLVIYEEAWELEERKGPSALLREVGLQPLRDCYKSRDVFLRDVPRLIVEHNLHGIDIDVRCAQIAALALWMRAQRAYNDLGLPRDGRPTIRKTNIVVAEPMPGEKDLLKEFTATLQPKLLGHLVEVTFDKMQLAGEAGSLLQIEDELSATIAHAKKQWLSQPKPEQLRLFAGDQQSRPDQLQFDLSGITDEQFWNEAETLVLVALRRYAEHAVKGMMFRRKLFADDAARGFAFIDLCRKRYNVVLMNPPFGEPAAASKSYIEGHFEHSSADILQAFVDRGLRWLSMQGREGVISARTGFFLGDSKDWRANVVFKNRVVCFADLGLGVLDDALVEVATYVIEQGDPKGSTVFTNRQLDTREKGERLLKAVEATVRGEPNGFGAFDQSLLKLIPDQVFAYWAPASLLRRYSEVSRFGKRVGRVRQGVATADDFRFARLSWEVGTEAIGLGERWQRFSKGGEYSPPYDDIHLLVDWGSDGAELKAFPGCFIRNDAFYFKPGATYTVRTASAFAAKVLPAGCIFSHNAQTWFTESNDLTLLSIGYLSCRVPQTFLELAVGSGDIATAGSAARRYTTAVVESVPAGALAEIDAPQNLLAVQSLYYFRIAEFMTDETSCHFENFHLTRTAQSLRQAVEIQNRRFLQSATQSLRESARIDQAVCEAFQLTGEERHFVDQEVGVHPVSYSGSADSTEALRLFHLPEEELMAEAVTIHGSKRWFTKKSYFVDRRLELICHHLGISPMTAELLLRDQRLTLGLKDFARSTLSEALGCAFGRWDIRFATRETPMPELTDPFAPLPPCPPGMLQNEQGLPLRKEDVRRLEAVGQWHYPLDISWDGILVDEAGHPLDIESRVRQVLEIVWKERAEEVEHEASEILGVHTLRDYFRKPAGFFADHLSRYSKSRRRAPIYWQLTTASGSYSIWLYYHRFTPDTFYKVLNDYVKPKFDHEQRKLDRIRADAGLEPNRSQRQEIDGQETFVAELRTFQEEIERIAPLWNPDLNDGVMINFAPLWRLVPQHRTWQKECKECWDKLVASGYDWSHLALYLWPERVVPKCQEDASLAIAHGLEEAFWGRDEKSKWVPKEPPKGGWKLVIDKLVTERTKPAVKAAMESLLNAPTASRNGRGRGTIARKRKA